jgi:hypothetical protein
MSGFILLVLIGLGAAWLFTRVRRRLGLGVNGKHWGAVIVVVAVLMMLFYGTTQFKH